MPAQKRAADADGASSRRRSGRLSTSSKKSVYFEDSEDESELDARPQKKARVATPRKPRVQKEEEEDDEEAYKDEDDGAANEEDQDDDEDDEESVDESKPPKVTVIPLEQMRGTGGVEYEDSRVHKNTMLFLKDLKANNKRTWLKAHDGEYRRAWKDWESFVTATTLTMTEVDETIPDLPAKDVVFRIYRDIRFSKDATPYKAHFSAAWSRTGRKGPYAFYYIHCEPGNTFIGGGLWHPEAQYVQKLRRSIDRHPERWRDAFSDPLLQQTCFPNVKKSAGVEGIIKAFVAKNQANALKKKPMGYEATHRDIELLKLKNYTLGTDIDESLLLAEDAQEKLADIMRSLAGYVTFINSIVMPDPSLDDSESDDDEEEE